MKEPKLLILGVLGIFLAMLVVLRFFPEKWSSGDEVVPETSHEFALKSVSSEDILNLVKARESKLSLVNLWATFCGACIAEFPDLLRAYREYRDQGLDLIFVSLDEESERGAAQEFLDDQRVDFQTYIKKEADQEFLKSIHPDWKGVIPVSLFYDSKGNLLEFVQEPMTFEQIEARILKYLGNH